MSDDPTPSVFVLVLAYGGFFAISLLLFLALHRARRHARRYFTAQQHFLPDVVEDDGEYE